jgi:hypothetical protein
MTAPGRLEASAPVNNGRSRGLLHAKNQSRGRTLPIGIAAFARNWLASIRVCSCRHVPCVGSRLRRPALNQCDGRNSWACDAKC